MSAVKKTIEFLTGYDTEIRVVNPYGEGVVIGERTTHGNDDYTDVLTLSRESARTLAAALEEVLK